MIEGSDLDAAYAPLSTIYDATTPQTPLQSAQTMTSSIPKRQLSEADEFHKNVEHKQRIMQQASNQQQPPVPVVLATEPPRYVPQPQPPSYLNRLYAKRRDVYRMVQVSMVVLLALGLHHFFKHAIKRAAVVQQWTADRELFARGMYPVAILFVLWNMRLS